MNVYLPGELVEAAKDNGLNLSRILEMELVERLNSSKVVAPAGFEPTSRAPKARMLGHYTTGLQTSSPMISLIVCFGPFWVKREEPDSMLLQVLDQFPRNQGLSLDEREGVWQEVGVTPGNLDL